VDVGSLAVEEAEVINLRELQDGEFRPRVGQLAMIRVSGITYPVEVTGLAGQDFDAAEAPEGLDLTVRLIKEQGTEVEVFASTSELFTHIVPSADAAVQGGGDAA
jgi:hypothetical protein